MITIIALLIGILIFGAGIYYFVKDKSDAESRKIYGVTAAVGAVIVLGGWSSRSLWPGYRKQRGKEQSQVRRI